MDSTPQPTITSTTQVPTAPTKSGFDFMGILPLGLIFVVFYFLVFRPQQQKIKEQKSMLEALKRGDRVVTESGIIGTILKFDGEREVCLEIADNVEVRFLKTSIAAVLTKGSDESKTPTEIKVLPRKKTQKK